jgi:hypothetical protein
MGGGEQCRWRERSSQCDQHRFTDAKFVEDAGDAVGPSLQGGHCVRSDGIRRAGAGLINEN